MKFSIVVPIYNVAPYLRACLESLLAQSCNDWEAICVDDGSTDDSRCILNSFAARDERIKVIRQENLGVSVARNRAIEVARGEWIVFLDADDQIYRDWLSTALNILREYPQIEILHFNDIVSIWSPDDLANAIKDAEALRVENIQIFKGNQAIEQAVKVFAREGWPMKNFVRRDVISSLRFTKGVRFKEDILFFLELGMHIECLATADYPGYFYTRRDGSAVMRARDDYDSAVLARELLSLGCRYRSKLLWEAITVALGYDFIQWADERDAHIEYNLKQCEIRKLWRQIQEEGGDNLSKMYFWWRIAIRHWLKTGDLSWAHRIRRAREWMGRFI